MSSIQKFSRITGGVYLFVAIAGMFGISYLPGLIVPGDINSTISNILAHETIVRWAIVAALFTQLGHLLLVLMLYRILKPVNTTAARLMVMFVLVGIPIAMLNEATIGVVLNMLDTAGTSTTLIAALLDFHAYGIIIVQIFWGLWLFPFGYLIYRSDFLPKIIGITLMIGCFGYLTDSLIYFFDTDFPVIFTIYLFWGEIIILLWLIIKGVNVEKWLDQTDITMANA